MTRILSATFLVLALSNTAAHAWGKTCYYSYSSDRSASYTTESSDKAD